MNKSEHLTFKEVKINDEFWNSRINTVKNNVIPYQYEALRDKIPEAEKSYCIENFIKAKKIVNDIKSGKTIATYPVDKWHYTDENSDPNSFHGWVFQDTDVYKWIEASAYLLNTNFDLALYKNVCDFVDLICSAQLDNGYLDTLYIINNRDEIFTNLKDYHELYCFGHLTEAAIALYNSTGNDKLLNASIKFADLICSIFGDGENKIKGYPGHEIAELALVKLYKTTKDIKYFSMADFFIKERGKSPHYYNIESNKNRNTDEYIYNQAHIEPVNQNEAVGHSVRAVYLYSGMADVAKEKDDEELYTACKKIWSNIVNKKMYITGGIGSTSIGEAFTQNYDLPNDLAYCETCASIGLIFFARRMNEYQTNSEYADVCERALYNTILSSTSHDGKAFFYVNPLESIPQECNFDERKKHIKTLRQKWFSCACCPPNYARLIASLNEYIARKDNKTIYIDQYIGCEIDTESAKITLKSDYLNSGKISIDILPKKGLVLALRIPKWCNDFEINKPFKMQNGYACINIDSAQKIEIAFSEKIKIIKCSNLVKYNIGKAAISRGPIIYCAESIDNGKFLQTLILDKKAKFDFDGFAITTDGYKENIENELYTEYRESDKSKCNIKLIPYYYRANRGECEMSVYLRIE